MASLLQFHKEGAQMIVIVRRELEDRQLQASFDKERDELEKAFKAKCLQAEKKVDKSVKIYEDIKKDLHRLKLRLEADITALKQQYKEDVEATELLRSWRLLNNVGLLRVVKAAPRRDYESDMEALLDRERLQKKKIKEERAQEDDLAKEKALRLGEDDEDLRVHSDESKSPRSDLDLKDAGEDTQLRRSNSLKSDHGSHSSASPANTPQIEKALRRQQSVAPSRSMATSGHRDFMNATSPLSNAPSANCELTDHYAPENADAEAGFQSLHTLAVGDVGVGAQQFQTTFHIVGIRFCGEARQDRQVYTNQREMVSADLLTLRLWALKRKFVVFRGDKPLSGPRFLTNFQRCIDPRYVIEGCYGDLWAHIEQRGEHPNLDIKFTTPTETKAFIACYLDIMPRNGPLFKERDGHGFFHDW